MATNTMLDWKFKDTHVQPGDVLDNSGSLKNFVSAESVVLAAGPATYSGMLGLSLVGLCDSVSVSQNKNLIQLFELGSKLSYIFPGRNYIQMALNRVIFNGDSLMGIITNSLPSPAETGASVDLPGYEAVDNETGAYSGKFYLNLASSFFSKSFGLGFFIQDSDASTDDPGAGQWVAGYYAENCMIQSHQMAVQGQQFIVMENAVIRCTNLRPIDVRADSAVPA